MNNTRDNNEDNGILTNDFLQILSLYLQVKNLQLNEQQVKDLNEHLQTQDNKYLQTIIKQNEELKKQNEKIISLLRGKNG